MWGVGPSQAANYDLISILTFFLFSLFLLNSQPELCHLSVLFSLSCCPLLNLISKTLKIKPTLYNSI